MKTYQDFLDTVKVLRMLYGVEISTVFFEKNLDNVGLSIKDLQNLRANAKLDITRENSIQEV